MGKRNETTWTERLRAIGIKGKLPGALTQAVVDAAQAHPLGFQYSLADGNVRGLALAVRANGAGAFVFEYRTPGGQHRRHGLGAADSIALADVRTAAEKLRAAVHDGEDPIEQRRAARADALRAEQSTVRAYLTNVYGPEVLRHAKNGGAPERPSTTRPGKMRKADGTWGRILSSWGPLLDVSLPQLTRSAIEKVLADRKDAGRLAGTLLRDWSAFRAMLADAVDRGYLAAIPMARRPEPIRKLRGNQRVRYLGQKDAPEQTEPGEAQRFNAAISAFNSDEPGGGDFLRFASGLALATGMRRGEIVRLTDKLINRRERRIELTADITKSNKPRTVYLSNAALAALDLWKVRGTGGELCPGNAENWEDRITQREWPRLSTAAQLEDFHFHDCRHDYAVRLLRSGATLAQVRDALGHASVSQTEKYAHVLPGDVRNAVLSLGAQVATA